MQFDFFFWSCSRFFSSPVGLLDGLSDQQQDEIASLMEPLCPTGVLVDLDEEHETAAGCDICLFSATLPLESNENIRWGYSVHFLDACGIKDYQKSQHIYMQQEIHV